MEPMQGEPLQIARATGVQSRGSWHRVVGTTVLGHHTMSKEFCFSFIVKWLGYVQEWVLPRLSIRVSCLDCLVFVIWPE